MAGGRIVLGIANPALDTNGNVDSLATLTFYLNNTTTPQAVYTDSTLGVALSNPLSPDAAGRFPAIWAPDLTFYTVKWTPNGASPITYNDIQNTNGTAGVGTGQWTPTDASGAGLTLTKLRATYTKISSLYLCDLTVSFPATADATAAKIGGLPGSFANVSGVGGSFMLYYGGAALAVASPVANSATFAIFSAAGVALTNANLSTATLRCQFMIPAA